MEEFKAAMKVSVDATCQAYGIAPMPNALRDQIVDGLINMLRATCQDADRYHLLIGFLNELRLAELRLAEGNPNGGSDNSS